MTGGSPNRWKTLWEKEKLVVKSNFSFSHLVSIEPVLQTRKNQACLAKGVCPFCLKYDQEMSLSAKNLYQSIDSAVFNAVFNSILIISQRPVQLSMVYFTSILHKILSIYAFVLRSKMPYGDALGPLLSLQGSCKNF